MKYHSFYITPSNKTLSKYVHLTDYAVFIQNIETISWCKDTDYKVLVLT